MVLECFIGPPGLQSVVIRITMFGVPCQFCSSRRSLRVRLEWDRGSRLSLLSLVVSLLSWACGGDDNSDHDDDGDGDDEYEDRRDVAGGFHNGYQKM